MSRLVPKLRFKEFSGEWEEKNILSFASMKARIGWQNLRQEEHLPTGKYYLITGTDFNDGIIDWKNAKYVEYERYIQDIHIILEEGDILITKDGSIGKLAFVENIKDKKATLNNGIFRIRINENNPKFIYYTFVSSHFKTFLNKLSAGSSINHLYQKDFEKYQVIFPKDLKEQQKIADTLSSLDALIEAQNQKVEALKRHKIGLMQQLFPSEGERVPKLRFKEFSGEWEEKTIDDLANRYDNLRIPITASNRIKGNTPYYGANGVQSYVDGYTHDGEFILVAEDGANDLQNYPVQYVNGKVWVNNHAHVLQAKKGISTNKFLMYSIKNINIEPYLVGGGRAKLNANIMMKISLFTPKLEEQQKIANTLSSLDALIEAQNQKVEALKEHKKGLMQQMFVSGEG